jgi:hypothetical protein
MKRIMIGSELTKRYQDYADVMRQPFNVVLQSALDDWMSTVGEGDMELTTGVAIDTDAEHLGLPVVPCVLNAVVIH